MIVLLAALLVFLGGPPAADGLPTVPGARNPEVTQANIAQTICKPNWSLLERKKLGSHADTLKFRLMDKAGIPRSQSGLYELDHDWSIEAGGSPTDPNNLWLEPYFGPLNAHHKDRVEDLVHRLICSGKMTLEQGGQAITKNWVATYRAQIGQLP
jgi:hypothetical protein